MAELSKVNKLKPIPEIPLKASDPDIKIDKNSPTEATIQTPENGSVAFRWQRNHPDGSVTSGVITPLSQLKPNAKVDGAVEIKRLEDGSHQVTTEKGTICTVLLKKQNGEKVEVPINASIAPPAENKAHEKTETKSNENPLSARPSIAGTFDRMKMPGSFIAPQESTKTSESLEAQAKKFNLPDLVVENAKKADITDLSKVKIINDEYQYCTDSACVSLGKVEAANDKTSAKPTDTISAPKTPTEKPTEVRPPNATSSEAKTVVDLNLKSIPPGSKLSYSYTAGETRSSGSIEIPAANSGVSSIPMSGIGTFSKNSDGTFKFDQAANFNGTISNQNSQQDFKAQPIAQPLAQPQPTAQPQQSDRRPIQKVLGAVKNGIANVVDKRNNTIHLSPDKAREYVENHPNENIAVVLTSPAICGPCRSYEPVVDQAISQSKNVTFIIANTGKSYSAPSFDVTGIPMTILYSQNRSNGTQESTRFDGYQAGPQLKSALDYYLK